MKNFYKENRVFSILMLVAIVCLLTIAIFFIYFFSGQGANKYGNRLEGINAVKITKDKIKTYETSIKEENGVEKVTVNLEGKIFYVVIYLKVDASVNDGVNASLKTLKNFNEKELSFYDFNFIVQKEQKDEAENFPVMGYKKSTSANIVWTKY